jgi:hypothetical protein
MNTASEAASTASETASQVDARHLHSVLLGQVRPLEDRILNPKRCEACGMHLFVFGSSTVLCSTVHSQLRS